MTTAPQCVSNLQLACLPSAVAWARRHTRSVLTTWAIGQTTTDIAELLVSELVTNAVRATGYDDTTTVLTYTQRAQVERCSLTLQRGNGRLLIEVADSSRQPPVRRDAPEDEEHGRGLTLVERLSLRWSYYYPGPVGKVVWCEVALI
ncbi:ATP-binding protein [Streptomyces sp. DSM 41524]|uniref:ATP-binding protein n=1 Tax=Streptomyces asiaticus subsp. ignotus TaxID=3098222 RepID=A0ABU7Q326_9ACTN|nr:ATP-binding protein [Streptomyces sp. DSM 41524]